MKEEIVDSLDPKTGEIIGKISKDIAHKDGIWHRSIHVWIINDNNQILLQQRCKEKDFYPNVWDASFAGHVGSGEDSITSAIREGEEELGIKIDTTKLQFLFTNKEMLNYKEINSNEFVDIYLLKQYIKIEDIVLQETEVSGIKYVDITDFIDMINKNDECLFPHKREYQQLIKHLI